MRYLSAFIKNDLKDKMVFLGGPRQVGKTTLALSLLDSDSLVNKKKRHPQYFNYDTIEGRKSIIKGELPFESNLIVLDEIHKYQRWRNLVKGFFDEHSPKTAFLVTGSARLDHYRRGGDSLHGRYHRYRLHPFSLLEISKTPSRVDAQALLRYGGFPEPFFRQSETAWRRWSNERLERIIHEDVRDLERVSQIDLLDVLVDALPARITTPLSVNSVAAEMMITHQTVERWLKILENLYVIFRIMPYGESKISAVKKEKKVYFWDWSQAGSDGARFENLVACQLLKYCHFLEDTQGYRMELKYIRDVHHREVDFVVLQDKKPLFAVEAKLSEKTLSPHLKYFSERTKINAFYQVHMQDSASFGHRKSGLSLPYWEFCKELGLP